MDQSQLTHGFLPQIVNIEVLKSLKTAFYDFLSLKSYPSYTSNINDLIPEISQLVSHELKRKIQYLLSEVDIELCNVEGHYLPPGAPAIPAHQDNFYHAVNDGRGLKILVPMSDFNQHNGSLTYLDCPSSIGTKIHFPSCTPNFSAEISKESLSQLNYQRTCYNYTLGDASYHLLNSIHLSHGNNSSVASSFLVFRYQPCNAGIDESARRNYQECYESHLNLLNKLT